MTRTLATALTAGMLLAGAASAQTVQSGAYTLEPTHAEIVFSVSHFGYSNYFGQFPGATGTLTLDGADPAKSEVDVTVPTATVMTASPKLNDELKSADWLDSTAFPTMKYHSTKIVMTGEKTADVYGDLTLHGVTKPLVLKATFKRGAVFPMNQKYMIGFDAVGHLKRSDFGVSKYATMGLGDDVDLIISAPFVKAS
jgi:polyisoprenoid-binding protein YceI